MLDTGRQLIAGVHWNSIMRQWQATLEDQTGTMAEYHDCLLDAVASRLRFEKEYWITGGSKAIICALEQENAELRARIEFLELNLTTHAIAGWQTH